MNGLSHQSDNLKFIDNFKTESWTKLTSDQKLENLQRLENYIADKQGRIVRQVRAVELPEGVRGGYNQLEPGYLNINKNLLEKSASIEHSSYKAMQNVIHEGRHAYQDDAIIGRIKTSERDSGKIEQWARNSSVLGGVYNSSDRCHNVDYRFQPKEVDAHDFAKRSVDSFSNRLGDDKNYTQFTAGRDLIDEYNKALAREIYGDDYEEKIANSINEKYRNKNQMKTSSCNENENIKIDSIKEKKKMSGLGNELKKLTSTPEEAAENQKNREGKLSQNKKDNSNTPSPQVREIGRQPSKSKERNR